MWQADLEDGTYQNPILYADYSDPDAIRVGDDYYMISSSFSNAPAIPLLHSKDLVNWKVVNYILDGVPEFYYRNPMHGCGVWAPSIRYHDGTFFVCFPMPDEGIYMTTAKDPLGKWSKPVNIRPGAGWIDPCPFWDEDGKAYLVAGVAKSRIGYKSVLHMVEMQPDGMGLIGEEKVVFDGNLNDQVTIEGPKLYRRNGWYYIFAPAGGVKTGWQTVLRSRDIFGPYEYRVVLKQGDAPVNGPHQGAWVDTVTGEDWFLHFQDVYAAGRIIHLQPMRWENDWPIIGEAAEGEICGTPVMRYRKPDVGLSEEDAKALICEPDNSDDFTGENLGLQWQWNANYDKSWYTLENGLCLNAVPTTPLRPVGDYPNLLLQKWPAPEFTCVTELNFSQMCEGDFAGVISMGTKYMALGVRKIQGRFQLECVQGEQQFDMDRAFTKEDITVLCENIFALKDEQTSVFVRYSVKRTATENRMEGGLLVKDAPQETTMFEWSLDGETVEYVTTAPAKAGRWVGMKNGMFIVHDNTVKAEAETGKTGRLFVNSVVYDSI